MLQSNHLECLVTLQYQHCHLTCVQKQTPCEEFCQNMSKHMMPQPSYVVCQPTEKILSPNSFKVSSQAGCFTNIHKQHSRKDWNVSTRARVLQSNHLASLVTLPLNLHPKANTLRRILSKHVKTHDASAVIRGMPAHGENLVAKQLQGIITGRLLHKHSQATFTQRLECINKSTGAAV